MSQNKRRLCIVHTTAALTILHAVHLHENLPSLKIRCSLSHCRGQLEYCIQYGRENIEYCNECHAKCEVYDEVSDIPRSNLTACKCNGIIYNDIRKHHDLLMLKDSWRDNVSVSFDSLTSGLELGLPLGACFVDCISFSKADS
jgi:hypothetical protein